MSLFDEIKQDKTSGSGTILKTVQNQLLRLATEEFVDVDQLTKWLKDLLVYFPQFGLLHHFINEFIQEFGRGHNRINGIVVSSFIQNYINQWKSAKDKASEQILGEIEFKNKTVLLHSNSSAILNLFTHISRNSIKTIIWQTYSSPAGEGIIQAEAIQKLGIETNLFHEDAIGNLIKHIDFAVFGADLILKDQFVNKAGTYPISTTMNHAKKPVYVLADSRKVIDETDHLNFFDEPDKPGSEIYHGNNPSIRVHNYYFDFTPLSLVKKLFLG